ncbi:MAG: DUF1385 domain-containing protein [Candidatus Woesearchaeota archaeon]
MHIQLGGQAVIEGVTIRSPHYVVTSIRKGKSIVTRNYRFRSLSERYAPFRWPLLRGIAAFWDTLKIGVKELNYSAEQSIPEMERSTSTQKVITFVIAFVFGTVLFVILPYFATNFFGFYEEKNAVAFNIIDGIIKMAVFLVYVLLISQIKEIKRVFMYHGAEHKTVHCFESGRKLTPRNVKKFSPIHLRCGTSFILLVILVSILIFTLIPILIKSLVPWVLELDWFLKRSILLLIRLIFFLPILAVSYEILKLTARFEKNPLVFLVGLPGVLVQKITTKEPDAAQIEVAIRSVETAVELEKNHKKVPFD